MDAIVTCVLGIYTVGCSIYCSFCYTKFWFCELSQADATHATITLSTPDRYHGANGLSR